MKQERYLSIENYMKKCMQDSAHDKEHIYRVLYLALEIAESEEAVNKDILVAACMLHDIGREIQFKNPALCHAQVGAEMAYEFCMENGFSMGESQHIRECISTHRFRADRIPISLEAKILFDADKLDVTGTIGIARTLFYKGTVGEPLYATDDTGNILYEGNDTGSSFLHEYHIKLKNLYDKFYTIRANEIAKERQAAAVSFYNCMLNELLFTYKKRNVYLDNVICDKDQ